MRNTPKTGMNSIPYSVSTESLAEMEDFEAARKRDGDTKETNTVPRSLARDVMVATAIVTFAIFDVSTGMHVTNGAKDAMLSALSTAAKACIGR